MDLKKLKSARGFVKGTITRLYSFVRNELSQLPLETLKIKLEKVNSAFLEYESLSKEILCIDHEDSEDFASVEDQFYTIATILNKEINSRSPPQIPAATVPSTPATSAIKLPPIDIQTFTDGYTSRAYQLERDLDAEPSLEDLLCYLDKRALALEGTDQGPHHQQPQARWSNSGKVAAHAAAADKPPTCLNCATAGEEQCDSCQQQREAVASSE
ncbi:uncharacterized protein LOC125488539 isoform X2 [Plutella xylostella]|uniref:uncharacterized protein LOC125488539 isoform X2 n=1 Tax=Plutella xylostella TaxID=51655 RepID=UPI002032A50E|nr:uncharacterized protein LOC125488539 isoform X2 [Plutella xylostella]